MYRLIICNHKQKQCLAYFANHKQEYYDIFKAKKDNTGKNAILKLNDLMNNKIDLTNLKMRFGYNKPECLTVEYDTKKAKYILEKYL